MSLQQGSKLLAEFARLPLEIGRIAMLRVSRTNSINDTSSDAPDSYDVVINPTAFR